MTPTLRKYMSKGRRRLIICERCNRPRRVARKFDVGGACVKDMTKVACPACSRLVYRFAPDSIYCTRCAPKVSEVKVICLKCGRTDYPYIRDPIHCRPCNSSTTRRQAWRKAMPKTIVCVMCGLTKASWKKKESVCQACDTKRRIGAVKSPVNARQNHINTNTFQLFN